MFVTARTATKFYYEYSRDLVNIGLNYLERHTHTSSAAPMLILSQFTP
jgi:hypothetical protein